MKKSILLLLVCFLAISLQAQEHLKFKGVPIDGTLKEFVLKLEAKGLKTAAMQDGIAVLQGDFASIKECAIVASSLKEKDIVNKVIVLLPEKTTWSALYESYAALKDLLTEKYGEPASCIEEFQGIQPDTDNDKLHKFAI